MTYPLTLAEAIAEHMSYIRGTAYKVSKDLAMIDDYSQAAYVACVEKISKCNGDFKGYIGQTTAWTVRALMTVQFRERKRLSDNAILGSIFAALPDRDSRKQIKAAWKALPANHKRILRKHFNGTLPSDQRMNLSRARKALAQLLQSA